MIWAFLIVFAVAALVAWNHGQPVISESCFEGDCWKCDGEIEYRKGYVVDCGHDCHSEKRAELLAH